ncbi:hypothetical protein AGMMS4956_20780 [Bacteroidia bacterium]|nr:hypothetical protein AGMMS4956_20780 [Bacteroidia bacterium]
MKKIKLSIAAIALGVSALVMSSCIGSFALTGNVYNWNKTVTNQKFVNELVFLALCAVPVYEISLFIDGFILNLIEFWTGKSPMANVDKVIDTEKGSYHVQSIPNGYEVEILSTGEKSQLLYNQGTNKWTVANANTAVPFAN